MGAGLSIFTSPITAFDKDKDLDDSTLASLMCSCLCFTVMFMGGMKMPIKSPPMMMAMLVCCLSSLFSTTMVGTDLGHRFTRKSE
mgnify:CR=1 FL=1|jgi:hypothetical protein